MKSHYFIFIAYTLLSCLVAGCDSMFFEPLAIETIKDPVPKAVIINGPDEGVTVSTNSITFEWNGCGFPGSYFQCKLAGYHNDWIRMGNQDTTFSNLDEGDYTFQLKEFLPSGLVQDSVTSRNFTINAITGPALVMKPQFIITSRNNSFTISIMAEDVNNLLGAKTVLNFDSQSFEIKSVNASGNFYCLNTPLSDANQAGEIEINSILLDTQTVGASGEVEIASINFYTLDTAPADTRKDISFRNTSVLKDNNNQTIELQDKGFYNSVVEIIF